jgi:hypothetical protein
MLRSAYPPGGDRLDFPDTPQGACGPAKTATPIPIAFLDQRRPPTEGRGRPGHLAGASFGLPGREPYARSHLLSTRTPRPAAASGIGWSRVTPTITQLLPPPASPPAPRPARSRQGRGRGPSRYLAERQDSGIPSPSLRSSADSPRLLRVVLPRGVAGSGAKKRC